MTSLNPLPQPDPNLLCWLNGDRVCGPDCMAYETAPDGPDYQDKQWANCMLLVNAHRVGKHLVVLASQGQGLMKHLNVIAADQKRTAPTPPVPNPTGRP